MHALRRAVGVAQKFSIFAHLLASPVLPSQPPQGSLHTHWGQRGEPAQEAWLRRASVGVGVGWVGLVEDLGSSHKEQNSIPSLYLVHNRRNEVEQTQKCTQDPTVCK